MVYGFRLQVMFGSTFPNDLSDMFVAMNLQRAQHEIGISIVLGIAMQAHLVPQGCKQTVVESDSVMFIGH